MADSPEKDKACECKIEVNHLNSMQLMLMEALADKDWPRAETYRKIVEDTIKDVGKCAKVDLTPALDTMKNTKQYIEMKEEGIRVTLRTLEDAFWNTLFRVCQK